MCLRFKLGFSFQSSQPPDSPFRVADAACQALSCFWPAWSSQPWPLTFSWDCPQTAITASLGLSFSHHSSPCPSSLTIGVWTSGLGKWQEQSMNLTRQNTVPLGLPSVWYKSITTYVWMHKITLSIIISDAQQLSEWKSFHIYIF